MLTPRQIEEDRAERARLGPIAQALGLELDPLDRELTQALTLIADRREEGGVKKPVGALPPSSATHTTSTNTSTPPNGYDEGDRVVELMRAQREGREPAVWARTPAPAQQRAGGVR